VYYDQLKIRTHRLLDSAERVGDAATAKVCQAALNDPRSQTDADAVVALLDAGSPVYTMTPAQAWQSFVGGSVAKFLDQSDELGDELAEDMDIGPRGEYPLDELINLHVETDYRCEDLTASEGDSVAELLKAHIEASR